MSYILYIEDDTNNRILVRRILTAQGVTVQEADNARDGIEMALQNPPQLILMDISMPEMDGLTATAHIRNMPAIQHVPIIALTAHAMEGDREMALDAGCDGYISKPIDIDSFIDQVFAFLR